MFLPQHLSVSTSERGFGLGDMDSSLEEQEVTKSTTTTKKKKISSSSSSSAAAAAADTLTTTDATPATATSTTTTTKKKTKRTKSTDGTSTSSSSTTSSTGKSRKSPDRIKSRSLRTNRTTATASSEIKESSSSSLSSSRSLRENRRSSVAVSSLTAEQEKRPSTIRRTQSSPTTTTSTATSSASSTSTSKKPKKTRSKKNLSASLEKTPVPPPLSLEQKFEQSAVSLTLEDLEAGSVISARSCRSRRRRDDVAVTELPPNTSNGGGAASRLSRSTTMPEQESNSSKSEMATNSKILSRSTTLPERRKSNSKSPLRRSKSDLNIEATAAAQFLSTSNHSIGSTGSSGSKNRSRRTSAVAVPSLSPVRENQKALRNSAGTTLPKRQKTSSPNKPNGKKTFKLSRQKTFDGSTSPTLPSNPPRSAAKTARRRSSSLPGMDARKDMLKKSSSHGSSSKTGKGGPRSLKTVRFDDTIKVDLYELKTKENDKNNGSDVLKFWYSKEDLKMLMDHELTCIIRSSGTARGLHFCSRGIEHLLEGKDKASKIRKYVRAIMKMEADIKKRNATADNDNKSTHSSNSYGKSKELRTYSQTLTKEDRKRAYRLGFQDASEVQVMNEQNEVAEAQSNSERPRTFRPDILPVAESVRLLVDTHAPNLGESIRDFADFKFGGSVRTIAHAPKHLGDSVRHLAHAPVHTVKKITHNIKPILKPAGSKSSSSNSNGNSNSNSKAQAPLATRRESVLTGML